MQIPCSAQNLSFQKEEIRFPSLDQLTISGSLYLCEKEEAPVIVLCHQAGYNRAAYNEIAPKLCKMGFHCLSIDQRSGGPVKGSENATAQRAKEKGLPTSYLDAEQDIVAAINFASEKFGKQVILWGSSYSSALALKIANENNKVMAVLSFSPGEYFSEKMKLEDKIRGLNKPCFITSSRQEATPKLQRLVNAITSPEKVHFVPKGEGVHGSRALWEEYPDHDEYWNAVTPFLKKLL